MIFFQMRLCLCSLGGGGIECVLDCVILDRDHFSRCFKGNLFGTWLENNWLHCDVL